MWPKEDYQEHMLGYLDGLRMEFEYLIDSHLQQQNLSEFYTNLDITSECLWQLIRASDRDWEAYRYPLEANCDELLRVIRQLFNEPADGISFYAVRSFMLMGVSGVQREPEMASSMAS